MIMPLMYDILYSAMSYQKPSRKYLLNYLPALVVGTIIGILCYISKSRSDAPEAMINAYLFNGTLALQVLYYSVTMFMEYHRYRKNIFNYYIDVRDTDYYHVRTICHCYIAAFLLIYCEIIFKRQSLYADLYITIVYFVFSALLLFALGYALCHITGETVISRLTASNLSAAEVIELTKQAGRNLGIEMPETSASSAAKDNSSELEAIGEAIKQWTSRSDKPYLRESITLSFVADDMHVNGRTLSIYINSVLKQNFNNWINSMRIDEAKRLIEKDIDIPMLTVAVKCGFADTAMLSKKFKLFTGCTPTAFKQQLREGRDEA